MAKGTINSSTEHKYSIVSNLNDGSSLVMYQKQNSREKNFYYMNGFELSLSEFNLIKNTFGLTQRLGSKNKVTLNLDETGLIFDLATPNAHLRRSTVTLTDPQREVTSKISAFHSKTLRNIKHGILTEDEKSKKDSDQVWFRGKAQNLNRVIDQTFFDSQGIWRINNIVGIGRSNIACSAKLIVPILGWFGPSTKVIKFSKAYASNKYELFLRNLTGKDSLDSKDQNTLANLIYENEKEQVLYNKRAGMSSQQISGGGLTEDFAPGLTLSEFSQKESLREFKKLELLTKIMLEVLKLHKQGIYHGDLHTGNILIDYDKVKQTVRVKLIDFDNAQKLGDNIRLVSLLNEIDPKGVVVQDYKIVRKNTQKIDSKTFNAGCRQDIENISKIAKIIGINLEDKLALNTQDFVNCQDDASVELFIWIKQLLKTEANKLANDLPNINALNAQLSYDIKGIIKQLKNEKGNDPDVLALLEMQRKLDKTTKPKILSSDKKLLLSASMLTLLTFGAEGALQLVDSNLAISKNYVNAAVQLVAALGVIGFLAYAIQNLYAVKFTQRIRDFNLMNTEFTKDFEYQVQQKPTKSELEFITPDPASKAAKILGLSGQTGEPRTTEVKRTLFPTT